MERSLELSAAHSDGLSDKEAKLKEVKTTFKLTHRRTSSVRKKFVSFFYKWKKKHLQRFWYFIKFFGLPRVEDFVNIFLDVWFSLETATKKSKKFYFTWKQIFFVNFWLSKIWGLFWKFLDVYFSFKEATKKSNNNSNFSKILFYMKTKNFFTNFIPFSEPDQRCPATSVDFIGFDGRLRRKCYCWAKKAQKIGPKYNDGEWGEGRRIISVCLGERMFHQTSDGQIINILAKKIFFWSIPILWAKWCKIFEKFHCF